MTLTRQAHRPAKDVKKPTVTARTLEAWDKGYREIVGDAEATTLKSKVCAATGRRAVRAIVADVSADN